MWQVGGTLWMLGSWWVMASEISACKCVYMASKYQFVSVAKQGQIK